MAQKKRKLGFDQRGGVIVFSRAMLESSVYETMPLAPKMLMILLQAQWRSFGPVSYGVREAASKLGCTLSTACGAFRTLQERGFIVCINESLFNSKTGSQTRRWRLCWMPFDGKNPGHEWEKWQPEK